MQWGFRGPGGQQPRASPLCWPGRLRSPSLPTAQKGQAQGPVPTLPLRAWAALPPAPPLAAWQGRRSLGGPIQHQDILPGDPRQPTVQLSVPASELEPRVPPVCRLRGLSSQPSAKPWLEWTAGAWGRSALQLCDPGQVAQPLCKTDHTCSTCGRREPVSSREMSAGVSFISREVERTGYLLLPGRGGGRPPEPSEFSYLRL